MDTLSFEGWSVQGDTFQPYRRWRFLRDVPKHGIVAGNYLDQMAPVLFDDPLSTDPPPPDGDRFQVWDERLGRPRSLSEWEVAPFFDGEAPDWPLEGRALVVVRAGLLALRMLGAPRFTESLGPIISMIEQMAAALAGHRRQTHEDLPEIPAEGRALLSLVPEPDRAYASVHVAMRDIPDAGIQRGDGIVRADIGDEFPRMLGSVRHLGLDDYEVLRAVAETDFREAFAPVCTHDRLLRHDLFSPAPGGIEVPKQHQWLRERLYTFLKDRGKWGRRLKVFRSRLAAVRPLVAPVSAPIQATTDDGALFELLHQVGGRLPSA